MILLQNTLTRTKEEFKPQHKGFVTMYHCGPTVYNYPHIGNYRSYVFADTLRRVFEYQGFKVRQVMNVTDVDDKTIRESQKENISLGEFTRKYEEIFKNELNTLNILSPHSMPRATENIPQMIALIEDLLSKGVAYKGDDGIYFSIEKSEGYGALSRLDKTAEKKERIKNDEYDKENPQDFALWKFHSEDDGEAVWDAVFGKGRPGWHIECSAMAINELGPTIDIHTGGIDLIFPHHTNEIAQSECSTGRHFVNYWMHSGHLLVENKKMAKSLENFITLESLAKDYASPLAFRYFLLTSHYSTQTNFTVESVQGAATALTRLHKHLDSLPNDGAINVEYKNKFLAFINDDIDTPQALALIWTLLKDSSIPDTDRKATILDFDRVLGLSLSEVIHTHGHHWEPEIQALIDERNIARQNKNWAEADRLRDILIKKGVEVNDKAI